MDERTEGRGWGNVRFRAHRERGVQSPNSDDAHSRFVTGLIVFIAVALAYPWYAYWVQSHLLARDLEAGLAKVSRGLDASMAEAQAIGQRTQRASVSAAQGRQEATAQRRRSGVRVMGASEGRNGVVVVVDLGDAGMAESTARICQQAQAFVGNPLDGKLIRVQRYRGRQPATDAGQIWC